MISSIVSDYAGMKLETNNKRNHRNFANTLKINNAFEKFLDQYELLKLNQKEIETSQPL